MALTKWSDNITAAALQGNYNGFIQSSLLQLRLSGPISDSATNGIAVYNVAENTTYKVRLLMDTRFRVAACASIAMNTVMENYYRDAADTNGTVSANAYKETEITTQAGQVYMPVFYWASGSGKGWSEVYDTVEVRRQLTGTLELTTPPAKTQYNVGEELDLTGMVVSVVWSDGTKEAVTDYTLSGYDSSVAGTCTVTVAYQGASASFDVTVAKASVPGITLESLLNTTEGMDVIRNNSKNDDGTDTVTGVDWFTYAGNVCNNIYVSGNNWIGFGTSSEQLKICRRDGAVYYVYRQEGVLDGGTKFLKIRVDGYTYYGGRTDTKLIYEVFLFDDGCLYINIAQSPTNSSYIGTSSITDGTNTATLNIPAGAAPAAPVEITVVGAGSKQEIYYERYPRFVPVGIEIASPPDKMAYYGNELFDSSGLVVNLFDVDGNKKRITDYMVSGFDSGTSGIKTVTVSKDTFVATFDITISEVSIIGIEITSPPTKTEYNLEEKFNDDGLVVSTLISDGTKTETGLYQIAGFDTTTSGTKTVSIVYGDFRADFSINVSTRLTEYIGEPNPEDVLATLDTETGILTVSGTGEMANYSRENTIMASRKNTVKSLIILSGVTSIGIYAFYRYASLTDITLPSTLTNIWGSAFSGCTSLTDITLPSTLTNIWSFVFEGCTSLTDITIPSSVTRIGDSVFEGCTSLTDIYISNREGSIAGAPWGAPSATVHWRGIISISITSPPTKTQYLIGESLDSTGLIVTASYDDGTSETVTGYTLSGFDSTSAGNKIVTITYQEKTASFEVTVSGTSTAVSEYIGYPNTEDVEAVLDTTTGIITISGIGQMKISQPILVDYRAQATECIIEEGITNIDKYAFNGGQTLAKFTLPSTLTGKLESCFQSCGVEEIEIPPGITEVSSAFFLCGKLRKVTLHEGLEKLTVTAFSECTSLTEIRLPESLRVISGSAFSGDTGLTQIEFPEGLETITWASFSRCTSLARARFNGRNTEITDPDAIPETTTIVAYLGSKAHQFAVDNNRTFEPIDKLQSISITIPPTKTEYNIGDVLDITGMVVTASYDTGHSMVVTDYTLSGFSSAKPGIKTVTVTYQGFSDTFPVTVYGAVTGIRIAHYPDKVYYKLNDTIDTTGLQVVDITEGGLERPITDYTLSALDSSTTGNKQITVTYEVPISADTNAVYFAEFSVKVTATGDNPFEDNLTPYKITVHWPNGEFADIGNDDLTDTMTLQEGICSNNYFIFGGCICNMIEFTTHSRQFMGVEEESNPHGDIEVYVESKGTKVKIFTGTISSSKRTAGLTARKITAHDYLYKFRGTDIAWWYKNKTADKNMILTQKQFRDMLFDYLGIEQVPAKLYYDDALVPDTNQSNEINVANILKDLCLQNSVFGWVNRDGRFEYMHLPENSRVKSMDNAGNLKYAYYDAQVYVDTYESCEFTEGRIWYPKEFLSDPLVGMFTPGGLTAQEAYEANVYYNRNSFFVGDADWLDSAFQGDEYGTYTVMEPIFPICYGTTSKTDNQHLYRAQGYTLTLRGNPLNKVGDSIEITVRKTAADGTQLEWVIHSYIMSRTLKLTGDTSMTDVYTAKNGPYNGNDSQAGNNTAEHSAELFRLRSEGPTISYAPFTDGAATLTKGQIKKDRLRCIKRIKITDYEDMAAAGLTRADTIYCTWEV